MVLLLWGITLVLLAGLGMRWVSGRGIFDSLFQMHCRITWREFAIGAAICSLLIVPLTVFVGGKIARGNLLTYKEFWNGHELAVNDGGFSIPCTRDGPCQHTYRCDSYNHVHHQTRQVPSGKDANGNTTYRTESYTENHRHYHSCPYATEEWEHRIDTTLGSYAIGGRTFSNNPREWRPGRGIPGNVPQGHPEFWSAARARIAAGDPGPVTKRMDYPNYIFASQSTILKANSSAVERHRSHLPPVAKDITEPYSATKVYPVGVQVDVPTWNAAVMRFNAAFGTLEGDLHLVLVGDQIAKNPAEYTNALRARWTGQELGRNTISKNGFVVVIGTDGQVVKWARAFTGMPSGNETLLTQVQHLKGEPLVPDSLLGRPVGKISAGDVKVINGDGKLETMVWKTHRFNRVHMSDFSYLSREIQPTAGQKGWILVVAFFLCTIVWGIFIAVGHSEEETTWPLNGIKP
jgi:hypothetical protein